MKLRGFIISALLAVVPTAVVVAPVAVWAQAAGTISGAVTDGAGKPLGKARITVSGPASSTSESKSDGTFSIPVPPGIYSVTVSASGFQSARNDNVVVAPDQSVALTIGLTYRVADDDRSHVAQHDVAEHHGVGIAKSLCTDVR